MWCLYIVAGVAVFTLARQVMNLSDIKPLIALDFTQTVNSSNSLVMIAGYALAPFVPLIVSDFFYYWFHRLQHAVPLLWRVHEVHHSIEELNAVNCYHHALEEILRLPMMILPMTLLIKVDVPQVVVVTTILGFFGLFIHTNACLPFGPLRYLFVEPRFHRLHHSIEEHHWGKNFSAFFALWDVIFRTAYFPGPHEQHETGTPRLREPSSIVEYFAAPFR